MRFGVGRARGRLFRRPELLARCSSRIVRLPSMAAAFEGLGLRWLERGPASNTGSTVQLIVD